MYVSRDQFYYITVIIICRAREQFAVIIVKDY